MSITSKFKFTGDIIIPRDEDKFLRKGMVSGGKYESANIGFTVKESANNAAYVQLFGMVTNTIKTKDSNNNNIEIEWSNRFEPDVVKNVASYRKHFVDLGEEIGGRKEFITDYDTAMYLYENLPNLKGKVMVTGNWEKNEYNGTISDRFRIGNVYAVSADSAPCLSMTMDFFYNQDSVDTASYDESGKIYIDGYVLQYDRDMKKNLYFPQIAVLSSAAFDLSKAEHLNRWKYRKGYLDKASKKGMSHILWECRYVNGPEEVEFDESMLSDAQKEQIELGIRVIDDFKPKNGAFGSRLKEVRLKDPLLNGVFSDGLIECDETIEEFMQNTFNNCSSDGGLNDNIAEVATKVDDNVAIADEVAGLF